ncbi:hypothetical protein H0H92_012681 [Tricholoma furcatifolium]|nr:hypothetical protein H0H92_012681 [Tricholoma furcatifolium]
MPLFKKKDQNLIPPVQDATQSGGSSPRSPYRSNVGPYAPTPNGDRYGTPSGRGNLYNPGSRDDPYNTAGSRSPSYPVDEPVLRDKYSRGNGVGDVYSRGTAQIEQDRNELFAGYNPQKSGSGRFFDGPQSGREEPNPGEENEEDIEGIKQQTRFMKQESVTSTRNALRMAREAEETARNTLVRLGDQSEKLANTERHLDVAKGHSSRAEDNTKELKQLNRSIFRPVIVFNKDAKRAAQEAKVQARYEDERLEREKTMMDIRETQNRLGQAYDQGDGEELIGSGVRARYRTAEQQATRKRYQFEATASDDELEDEMDSNLNDIQDVTSRLKKLATTMSSELDTQNRRIDEIEGKTVRVEQKISMNTYNLKRINTSDGRKMVSEYEKEKARNIERNAALLRSLGLDQPLFEPREKKTVDKKPATKKRRAPIELDENKDVVKVPRVTVQDSSVSGGLRRSSRTSGKKVDYASEQIREILPRTTSSATKNEILRRHDPINATSAGKLLALYRMLRLAHGGQAGWSAVEIPYTRISGGPAGAYSVALSGGYEDDVDLGYALWERSQGNESGAKERSCLFRPWRNTLFVFTELVTSISFARRHRALIKALTIRYRYDGLYKVEKAWIEEGLNPGKYLVCKFAFKRLPGQSPLPVRGEDDDVNAQNTDEEGEGDAENAASTF